MTRSLSSGILHFPIDVTPPACHRHHCPHATDLKAHLSHRTHHTLSSLLISNSPNLTLDISQMTTSISQLTPHTSELRLQISHHQTSTLRLIYLWAESLYLNLEFSHACNVISHTWSMLTTSWTNLRTHIQRSAKAKHQKNFTAMTSNLIMSQGWVDT